MRNLIRNAQGAEKTGLYLTDIGKKWRWTRLLSVLIILLTLGVRNAWGDVTAYTFSTKYFATSGGEWTYDVAGNGYNESNGGIQCNNSHRGKAHTNASVSNVSSVIVIYSADGTNGSIKVQIGTNDVQTFPIADPKVGTGANACAVFDYPTAQSGSVSIQGYSTGSNIYIAGVVIVHGALSCNNIAVGSSPIILPAGNETYTAQDWRNSGVTQGNGSYGYPVLYTTGDGTSNYCVITGYAYDGNTANGLQFRKYGGLLILHGITSSGGVSIEIKCSATSSANGFSIDLTGAETQTGKYTGTTTISTTETNATLVIRKPTDGAGYLTTIKISPNCAPPATELAITNDPLTVAMGSTLTMTTNSGSGGGNGASVAWSIVSGGTGSATINPSTGVLNPSSAGTVIVKAHQDGNTVSGTDYCPQDAQETVTITIPTTSVSVSPTSKAIIQGETFEIAATVEPDNATDMSVSWLSANSSVATVDDDGDVTGVAAGGPINITCTTNEGSHTANCAVTVYGVTMQAQLDGGGAIPDGGPDVPTRDGINITPAADAGGLIFKQWNLTNATLGSSNTTKANTITSPTGSVTATAVYWEGIAVTWMVNGEEWTEGNPTTKVATNTQYKDLTYPTDPDPGDFCGDKFMGWTTSSMGSTMGQSAPGVLLTTANRGSDTTPITTTTTFYAVFGNYTN